MITAAIIELVAGLVQGVLGLVPEWNIDMSAISGFTTSIGSLIGRANGYVPATLLFACIGLLLAMKLAFLIWRGILFVYTLIPFN